MRTPFWGLMGLGSRQMCPDFLLSHIVVAAAEPRWPQGRRVSAACWGPSPPRPSSAVNRGSRRAPLTPRGLTPSGAVTEGTAGKDATQSSVLVAGQEVTSVPGAV